MIDILYCAWNRLEFTRKSFETMLANTDWSKVSRLVVYDDGSDDGTLEYLRRAIEQSPVPFLLCATLGLGPVGVMRDFLKREGAPLFAKIDSDTMLPPGWLGECLDIMERNPGLGLLGIEARIDAEPSGPPPRQIYAAAFIGGIGVMRRAAFSDLPDADGPRSRFGFGAWQDRHPEVGKAWINPPLPVCLLNMVPFEPWASLSKEYVAKGWQRSWPDVYGPERSDLWDWWA